MHIPRPATPAATLASRHRQDRALHRLREGSRRHEAEAASATRRLGVRRLFRNRTGGRPETCGREDSKTPAPLDITGPWEVRFPPNLGAPPSRVFDQLVSWTTIPDDGIKYFSGTATYLKEFEVPAAMLIDGHRSELDLGQLRNVADATLNGKPLGILWKPPYTYNVTGIIRSGKNELKIEIVNLWANRLVGDAKLPRENA